jgi:hypothetical protein
MDKRKIILSSFKNSINEFLLDLKTAFPEEKYLWTYHSMFQTGMSVNPVDVLKKFIEYIGPYSIHIQQGNEDFFLEKEINSGYSQDGMRLKELWVNPGTTIHTKACIIAHLQKICKIIDKFN